MTSGLLSTGKSDTGKMTTGIGPRPQEKRCSHEQGTPECPECGEYPNTRYLSVGGFASVGGLASVSGFASVSGLSGVSGFSGVVAGRVTGTYLYNSQK